MGQNRLYGSNVTRTAVAAAVLRPVPLTVRCVFQPCLV